MRHWKIWVQKGCLYLLALIVGGITFSLLDLFIGGKLDPKGAVDYYMLQGFLLSNFMVSDLDRKSVLAVRFGAKRKSCHIGFEISRAIYFLGCLLSLAVIYPEFRKTSPNSLLVVLLIYGAALTANFSVTGLGEIARKHYSQYNILLLIAVVVIEVVILVLLQFGLYTENWILPLILVGIAAASKTVCLMQERKYLFSCNV